MTRINRPIFRFGIIVIPVLIAAFVYVNFSFTELHVLRSVQPKPEVNTSLNKDDFVLNGIFISERYKCAMINDHFYQVGDVIKGVEITSIEYANVRL